MKNAKYLYRVGFSARMDNGVSAEDVTALTKDYYSSDASESHEFYQGYNWYHTSEAALQYIGRLLRRHPSIDFSFSIGRKCRDTGAFGVYANYKNRDQVFAALKELY